MYYTSVIHPHNLWNRILLFLYPFFPKSKILNMILINNWWFNLFAYKNIEKCLYVIVLEMKIKIKMFQKRKQFFKYLSSLLYIFFKCQSADFLLRWMSNDMVQLFCLSSPIWGWLNTWGIFFFFAVFLENKGKKNNNTFLGHLF